MTADLIADGNSQTTLERCLVPANSSSFANRSNDLHRYLYTALARRFVAIFQRASVAVLFVVDDG